MEERFRISYNQAYPRVPRGWTSSEFNSRLGLSGRPFEGEKFFKEE
jgi:hypothetical protein